MKSYLVKMLNGHPPQVMMTKQGNHHKLDMRKKLQLNVHGLTVLVRHGFA
jgi:hypothetical protein